MINILFESHCTSLDNEAGLASGHYDVDLSEKGKQEAINLQKRHIQTQIDTIFCSDLKRSYKTAEIAFKNRNIPVHKDERLRECDYGDWTRKSKELVENDRVNRLGTPYPNGESIEERIQQVEYFLDEIANKYDNKTIMIIGHRVTRIALEHLLNNKSVAEAATEPNRWRPGWHYILNK